MDMTTIQFDTHFPKSELDLWRNCHWIAQGVEKCPNCQAALVRIRDDEYFCRNNGKCTGHAVYRCPGCGAEFHPPDGCPVQGDEEK